MKLTLLGTGSPAPDTQRRGAGQIVQCGDDAILIDCGAGILHRLLDAGYASLNLHSIAFTHLHSDHVTGIMDVLWAGWIGRRWQTPPVIYGPPGTRHFIDHLVESMSYDIKVRIGPILQTDQLIPRVVECDEGWSVAGSDWQLSAFRVEHLPVDQAFGFRVDQGAASVVVSGDTRPCDNLAVHAKDASLLVHEVFWSQGLTQMRDAAPDEQEKARFALLQTHHTPSTEVGKIATMANTPHLVLSHIIRSRGSVDDFATDIAPDYKGKLTVGADLMTFEV